MGFSLGGIVKGITTGLETLVETGNPYIAAGAGAIACFSGNSSSAKTGAPVQTFSPLLDEMSAELNPGNPSKTYSYTQLAGLDANGNATKSHPYGDASVADLVE
jgi:hypothetical protein